MGFTDWTDVGIFPLQDHDPDTGVPLRQTLVGGRIAKLRDPSEANGAADSMLEYAKQGGMGTLGDIHPWMFLQTRNRDSRGMGSWMQVMGGIVSEGGGRYAPRVAPFKDGDMAVDSRYAPLEVEYPRCLPRLVRGQLVAVVPSMAEGEQHYIPMNVDPRLVAANAGGPAEAATIVSDLQPDGELAVGSSTQPGWGGRQARLHSMMRVVPIRRTVPMLGGRGNVLAWNLDAAGQDAQPGFGAVWARLAGRATPVTPITPPTTAARGNVGANPGGFGTGVGMLSSDEEPRPCEFGEFKRRDMGARGTAFFAAMGASGPFHAGAMEDKHRLGVDADGQPMNSGHIATDAYFFRDASQDGPLLFEGAYPYPPSWPLLAKTHLTWDPAPAHAWMGGQRQGVWRWWTEVPYCDSDDGDDPPPITPPTTPTSPPGPGGPGTPGPGGPTTPPTRPPRNPPGRGGGGGPTTPTGPPSEPIPGGGDGPRRGPVTAPTRGPGSRRSGFTYYDLVGADQGDPVPPPTSEGGRGKGAITVPTRGPGAFRDGPVIPQGGPARGRNLGPNGQGSDGMLRDGRRPAGVIERVGEGRETLGSYEIFHPMRESFGALGFRPQLWVSGYPNFEHNPGLNATVYQGEERTRPQVVTLRAWGRQNQSGDWDYEERPRLSRARGGATKGGVVFTPPMFEMEDYLGIGDRAKDPTTRATTSFVAAAGGVGLALGEPSTDGALTEDSYVLHRYPTGTSSRSRDFRISHIDDTKTQQDIITARRDSASGESVVRVLGTSSMQIPRGTTAQRPATLTPEAGFARINTDLGATDRFEVHNGSGWLSMFTVDEHVSTSAGAGDAGKPVILNGSGLIDPSMVSGGGGVTDHGALTGLGDDDHTQYLLVSGARAMTGVLNMGSQQIQNMAAGAAVGNPVELLQAITAFMGQAGGTFTGDVTYVDNVKATFGTGGDADIYYDATDLRIDPNVVGSGRVLFGNHTRLGDNKKAIFGAGNDSAIYHDGTDLVIDAGDGGTGSILQVDTKIDVAGDCEITGDFYVSGSQGVTQTVTIEDNTGIHELDFTGGILTSYTFS